VNGLQAVAEFSVMQHADADAYLALAVDCLRRAREEENDSWMYVAIANAWMSLADRVETDDEADEPQDDTTPAEAVARH
jgi:hypothetical protein